MYRFPGFPFAAGLLTALLLGACLRSPHLDPEAAGPEVNSPEGIRGEFPTADSPDLILRTGEQPLWFEFGEEGLRQIPSPGEASLKPFEPWPLARYAVALLVRGEDLILGVNREGFLVIVPGNGTAAGYTGLRRVADTAYWAGFTLGALFFSGDGAPPVAPPTALPAALLYRNDFFSDSPAEPPTPPVWALLPGNPRPVPLKLPAFEELNAGGWEVDGLRRGPDGFWYYRGIQRSSPHPSVRYFRSPEPGRPGEEVSMGVYRNSALPELPPAAPPVLRETLETAFFLAVRSTLNIAAVLSPDFPGARYFSPGGAGTGEGLTELSGFYRAPKGEDPGGTGPQGAAPEESSSGIALVILPDGRGVYGRPSSSAGTALAGIETGPFVLPPLPEGFVYTGLGLVGKTLIAPWEERQEGSLGAAGFLAVDMPALFQ